MKIHKPKIKKDKRKSRARLSGVCTGQISAEEIQREKY